MNVSQDGSGGLFTVGTADGGRTRLPRSRTREEVCQGVPEKEVNE